MPWFKVDDKLHDHRKSRRAKKSAMGVWVLAGSWSADNLTDGFVPGSVLPRWGSTADARALVDAGLWEPSERDGERGWLFRNWSEYQPTRADVEADRERKAAAGRKGGTASGRSRRQARASAPATAGASRVVEPPTRPDPSAAAAAERAAAAELDALPIDGPPLAPELELLRSRLEARNLFVRWDGLTPTQVVEIVDLIETHGDAALVKAAMNAYRPDDPPRWAQAWLGDWRNIPTHRRGLAAVQDPPCDQPGHSGTTRHCTQCASERLAGEAR